jgi:Domain of unknown function (DUF4129)
VTGGGPQWRLPVPGRDAAQVHAIVTRILSESQFHPSPSLVQRVINAIVNWLDHVFNLHLHLPLGPGSGLGGGWLSDVLLLVLIAGVVALLIVAIRKGVFARLRHAQGTGVVVTEEGEIMAPEAWRREAERLAAEGRYREALRCRYRALVADLAYRGVLTEVPGRTTGDYERLVAALLPEVATQFSSVTRLFERCWYGHEPSDARAQYLFDEIAATIVAQVGSGRWRHTEPEPEPVGLR